MVSILLSSYSVCLSYLVRPKHYRLDYRWALSGEIERQGCSLSKNHQERCKASCNEHQQEVQTCSGVVGRCSQWPETSDAQLSQECSKSSYSVQALHESQVLYTFGVAGNSCCVPEAACSPGSLGLKKQRLHFNPCSVTALICGLEQVINALILWMVCSPFYANLKILLSVSVEIYWMWIH